MPITVVKKEYYKEQAPPFAPTIIPYRGEGMTVLQSQETVGYTGDEAIALAGEAEPRGRSGRLSHHAPDHHSRTLQ